MQIEIRLADFIRAEIEPILQDWEQFAKTLWHANHMSSSGLRDHARDMLLVIADDLDDRQSDTEQAAKSKGLGPRDATESWAEVHGEERQSSGFSVMETVSEFRALRASVVSHWTRTHPASAAKQLEELTRFHEAIDQAVAESLEHYATAKDVQTRLFGAILLASPDPIYVLDLEGRFVYANKATCTLFAMETKDIIGNSTLDLGFPFASDFQRNLEHVVSGQSVYQGKLTHTFPSKQGERFEYLLAPVLNEGGSTESAVCIFRDITERSIAEDQVWHHAHHDLLTGLPNRRLFLDRLEQEIKHAKRRSLPLAVMFMDLDGFKEVNDTHGHEAGDRLLQEVAHRLAGCVREEDTIARLGGDEFTVVLTGTKRQKAVELVAKAIIDAVAVPFHVEQQAVRVSVSIGISFYPWDAFSPADLLQAADQAMYEAKKLDGYRICSEGAFDRTDQYFSQEPPESA